MNEQNDPPGAPRAVAENLPGAIGSRSRRPRLIVAVLLLVVGGAAIASSFSASSGRSAKVRVVSPNLPLNGLNRADTRALNSPALAVNPKEAGNLAVVSRVVAPPRVTCGLHVSFDGGAIWQETPLPFPSPDASTTCVSPDAAFGADGTLYVSFVSFGPVEGRGTVPDAVWVTVSRDGGRTMLAPTRVSGPLAFHVRLAADPARPGRLWMAWLQASQTGSYGLTSDGDPIVVSRSDDMAKTWAPARTVSGPGHSRALAPALSARGDGQLVVAFLDAGEDRLDYSGAHEGRGGEPYPGTWSLVVARSSDGGVQWDETVLDRGVVPIERFVMLHPPRPSLAADGRKVYVAFHDGRAGKSDVRLWVSTDGARSFGPSTKANDTPPGDGTTQHLAQLAVAPSGRLDLVYFDRRDDPEDVMTSVSLQSSFDGGRHFTKSVRLPSASFDSRIGPGSDNGLTDLGDRLALASTSSGALAVWTDTRAGLPTTGKQDLARAIVAVDAPSDTLQQMIRWAGAALTAVALLLLLSGAASRRKAATAGSPRKDRKSA